MSHESRFSEKTDWKTSQLNVRKGDGCNIKVILKLQGFSLLNATSSACKLRPDPVKAQDQKQNNQKVKG